MICPKCGENGTGNFCPNCGTKLVTENEYEEMMFRRVEQGLASGADEDETRAGGGGIRQSGRSALAAEETREMPRWNTWKKEEQRSAEPARKNMSGSLDLENDRRDNYDDRRDNYDDRRDNYDDRREEDPDDYDDYDDYEDYDEPEDSSFRVPGNVSRAVNRSVGRIWDLICTGLRLVSAMLMLATAFYMAYGFLGNIRSISGGDSRTSTIYMAAGAGLVAWAGIQTLWIMKKSRVRRGKDVWYEDRGHGIFAFLVFIIIYAAAVPALALIPGSDPISSGVTAVLRVLQDLGQPFLAMQALGLILSFLRRICGSGMR